MVAVVLPAHREAVAVDRAGVGAGEGRVGCSIGAAGVARRHRQGGLAHRQSAVDVDHGVVGKIRSRRHRNDRVGPHRRAGGGYTAARDREAVAVDRAGVGAGEARVGRSIGAAGVARRHRQGGLAHRQSAVDVDHGVVGKIRSRRHRNDRVGPHRRAGGGGTCCPLTVKLSEPTAPV